MPGTSYDADADFDAQDQAEVYDESNLVGGEGEFGLLPLGDDGRTFEELPDVEDVTRALGDADDEQAMALDADEFDENAMSDADFEEDDELDYRAATAEREDDLDGLGPEDGFDEDRLDARSQIEGLAEEVGDSSSVTGGEDDFTNFQSKLLDDDDLQRLGYTWSDKSGAKS